MSQAAMRHSCSLWRDAICVLLFVLHMRVSSAPASKSGRRGFVHQMQERPLATVEWTNLSLVLLLRTCATVGCVHTYERDLRPSLLTFFPWRHVPLLVVLDHDDPRSQKMQRRFSERPPFAEVKMSVHEDDPSVWERGHERQQYSQFFADLYTDKRFVGFVDSDTLFITPVTPGDLFDPLSRPIVLAQARSCARMLARGAFELVRGPEGCKY